MNLLQGDCLKRLKELGSNSIDSLVTDPPAGISFMGKDWDTDKGGRKEWISWMTEVMRECHRVMKPGAHGLVWAIPRTSHWTATALEDAGFEVRDVVTHLFGSGFPKSLDISKAIDKAAGLERPRIPGGQGGTNTILGARKPGEAISGEAISGEAKEWSGWGTALKPASEHWILIRKPISEKNVAANVLKWGTGGINIDASRIEGSVPSTIQGQSSRQGECYGKDQREQKVFTPAPGGRFPANLILSHSLHCDENQCDIECAIQVLDRQSGTLKSGAKKPHHVRTKPTGNGNTHGAMKAPSREDIPGSEGGASRFFYCAKISKSERNAGLEGMPKKVLAMSGGAQAAAARGEEYKGNSGMNRTHVRENHHPTVKPKRLMEYLIRMVTPPGGTVLDPFMGSGSTGVAAVSEGWSFIGIERDPEYFEIAKRRVFHAFPKAEKQTYKEDSNEAQGSCANY